MPSGPIKKWAAAAAVAAGALSNWATGRRRRPQGKKTAASGAFAKFGRHIYCLPASERTNEFQLVKANCARDNSFCRPQNKWLATQKGENRRQRRRLKRKLRSTFGIEFYLLFLFLFHYISSQRTNWQIRTRSSNCKKKDASIMR